MKTLEEALEWYQCSRKLLLLAERLGKRHWDSLPWDGTLGKDSQLDLSGEELIADAEVGLGPLDDLAVLVLFSVFESIVRTAILEEIKLESATLRHVALRRAAAETLEKTAEGSFFRVLEPYKELDPDLIEQVNQVRRYRNWVAHGRRDTAPPAVAPRAAYDRLSRFLTALETHAADESSDAEAPE